MPVGRVARFVTTSTIVIMALMAAPFAASAKDPAPVDLILHDAKVVTVDRDFSIQSAVAVLDGKIVAVGGEELLQRYVAPRTIDLHGRVLMPGFIDTHYHLNGLSPHAIEPEGAQSIKEIQAMIAAKIAQLGKGQWVTGYGWDEAKLAEKRNLSRADLDAVSPNNPVILYRAGMHSVVANSEALRRAGITEATPDPAGGLIERDATGMPSGIIRERIGLVADQVPPDDQEQLRPSYIANLKALLPLGITSIMNATTMIDDEPVGKGGTAAPPRMVTWRMFKSIYAEHGPDLPRAILYVAWPGAERLRAFPYHTGYGDDRLRLGPIGESALDGGFTGPTAYTKADYKGLPGFRGRMLMTPEAANEMVDTAAELGWQLGIHTIGDAAIETMVGIYDRALGRLPKADRRWFLAHLTMLPSDKTMEIMARDGIAAAVQPNFLYTLEGRYQATLDGFRLEHVNPLASPARHGVKLAFGSDNLPVGPMVGLYAAITRKGSDGTVFGADEALSRRDAIIAYTRGAAYLGWDEAKKGSIEPGKFADMIVLDRDILTEPAENILKTNVDLTMVGGRIVYDRHAELTR